MFVILLEYVATLDEIDGHMKAHMAFVKTCYRGGLFIASGRRSPRTGGVILARGATRQQVEDVMAQDPFVVEGLARFEVIEFNTSQFTPEFAPFADPEGRAVPSLGGADET